MNNYPRLCGGTVFTLILQALKQRTKARERTRGEKDGLSDPEVLEGLIRIIQPAFESPAGNSAKTITNKFKTCQMTKSDYYPFGKAEEVSEFDNRVRLHFTDAYKAMQEFVHTFLDTDNSFKCERLVKALAELVLLDDTIADMAEFFVDASGRKTKKAALGDLREVDLSAFLLGVWHFAVVHRLDCEVGKETFDHWCPPNGGGKREYKGDMGAGLMQDILVHTDSHLPPEATSPLKTDAKPSYVPSYIEREYYNLFVLGGCEEGLEEHCFRLSMDRCLQYMSEETEAIFGELTPATVERIKCMPSLFMRENIGYGGKCEPDQKVIFGFIRKLQITENGVKVRFEPHDENIPQSEINAIAENLCIETPKGIMELNRTHWSIKRTDLIDELEEAGLVEM